MTLVRRMLRFGRFDQIMPDVERLLEGCTTVGDWSFAQICRHLSDTLRLTSDLPRSTPQDLARWGGDERKRRLFETGEFTEDDSAPPAPIPAGTHRERSEAERLRHAIYYYKALSGPVRLHPNLGPMGRAEWDRYHLMHCAHHLSFAIPKD